VARALAAALGLALPACGGGGGPAPSPTPSAPSCSSPPVQGNPALTLSLVARDLEEPVDVQAPPGERNRLFIVEQPGRIRIVRGGALVGTPFLDISARIDWGGERGLLGLAFHPRYSENGRFFVNYTDTNGDVHIAEFRAAPAADTADPGSERTLLRLPHPETNHNGGALAFGSDGMLYIGLGDGGGGGDPDGNGQNLGTPFAKILRINVDQGTPFAVPADNPFVSRAGAFGPVWAFGLRNPWRFSFDRATGDLYIGDVGEQEREEVDVGLSSRRGGENYGWSIMEGGLCFNPSSGCNRSGLTLPVLEYATGADCSVVGGFVYRGCRMPGWHGTYFYGDYCSAFVRSFRLQGGAAAEPQDWTNALGRGAGVGLISSFGVDAEGEMYIVDHHGAVYKVVPAV